MADIAKLAYAGVGKRPGQRRQRSKEDDLVSDGIERARTCVKRARSLIRTANTDVLFGAALICSGRPGQTAAPIGCVCKLPSADQVIHCAAGIAQEGLTPAKPQLMNSVDYKYMVASEIVR